MVFLLALAPAPAIHHRTRRMRIRCGSRCARRKCHSAALLAWQYRSGAADVLVGGGVGGAAFRMERVCPRAPSILAVALTAATLYAWLASSIGRRCALWSMLPLLSAKYSADAARQPRMDALLMLFLTVAIVSLERALSPSRLRFLCTATQSGALSGDVHRWMLMGCAALAMAAGVLTKGPIGNSAGPDAGHLLGYQAPARRRVSSRFGPDLRGCGGHRRHLVSRRARGRRSRIFPISDRARSAWTLPGCGRWPAVADCHHPFYYFIPGLVSGFFPCSLFYPALAILLWRERRDTPAPITFALCWFIAVLGFFTISSGKCLVYILPLFPALAAMTGWLIATSTSRMPDSDPARRWFDGPASPSALAYWRSSRSSRSWFSRARVTRSRRISIAAISNFGRCFPPSRALHHRT